MIAPRRIEQRSSLRAEVFALVLALGCLSGSGTAIAQLEGRLVGNAALEISDGERTLLVDFPYTSGAFGYLTYPDDELRSRPGSLCLFTHRHADHFDPALVGRVGCRVFADPSVQELVPEAARQPWNGGRFEDSGLVIVAVRTPHMPGHVSLRIEWHGRTLYLTGDTESTSEIEQQLDIDWLFITPWLLEQLGAERATALARNVVVYHREADQVVEGCSECSAPERGESISF